MLYKSCFTYRAAYLFIGMLFASVFSGCIGAAQPRFTPDIQSSLAETPMRRMDTEYLTLYYPAHRQSEARQFAAQLEICTAEISKHRQSDFKRAKIPVMMPEVEFNNAYVNPGLSGDYPYMLVPSFFTVDLFSQLGIPPDPSFISCHEAVHFIQATEITETPKGLNTIVGFTFTPQLGLDMWFWEGLATYYESRLTPGAGRMASPYWHQTLAAGFAGQDITSSALHTENRQIPFGGQYLVGSHFIRFLAETYGEEKLWEIIDRQSSSIFFPLGVNIRFRLAYGKSLHTLIGEFSEHIKDTYPERARPEAQRTLRDLGQSAQWAVAPDGIRAAITRSPDTVEELTIWSADGERLYRRAFPDVLPPRKLLLSGQFSGLSFTADSKHLYFTALSQGKTAQQTLLIHLDLKTHKLNILTDDLRGAGGTITPDGGRYIFPRADGNRHHLAYFDLQTHKINFLHVFPAQYFVVSPRVSPDGKRIAATVMHGSHADIWVFSAETGKKLREIACPMSTSTPRKHRDPTWLGNDTLLASTEINGRLQIVRYNLESNESTQLSDAPYLAVQPFAIDADTVGFLNRDGWGWTLDTLSTQGSGFADLSKTEQPGEHLTPTPGDLELSEDLSLTIQKDQPYSKFDGVFVPRLRSPMFLVSDDILLFGVMLSGYDTLGFHSWAIELAYDFMSHVPTFSAQYLNAQLAPWYLYFTVLQDWEFRKYTLKDASNSDTDQVYRLDRRDRQFSADLIRIFYDIPLSLSVLGTELYQPEVGPFDSDRRRFLGAKINAQYSAGRGTAYGGARNLFALDLTAAAFPAQVGSDFSLEDLRAETTIHLPLPFSNLHRLRVNARARALLGTPADTNLLRVGGTQSAAMLFSSTEQSAEPLSDILPRNFEFSESLRGYEDYGFATHQLFAAEVDYRYPFVIDAATASTFGVFPSFLLRQINFELFATAATFGFDEAYHAAAGASLDLQWQIWLLPFDLRYQLAQRLTDDEALVHTITLGVGL